MKIHTVIFTSTLIFFAAVLILPLLRYMFVSRENPLAGKSKKEIIRVLNRVLFDFDPNKTQEKKYQDIYLKIEELIETVHKKGGDDFTAEIEKARVILEGGFE